MSEISSDNLHHFTHSLEILQSILLNGFYPHITEEDISFILKYIPNAKAGFPIVCFCDLPNNFLEIHKKQYGNYGLSLSKEWGIKKGINPVMYVSDKNAQVMNYYRSIQQFILNKDFSDFIDAHKDAYGKRVEEIMQDYFFNVLCMSAFLRRYEDGNARFYDEREWRYLFIDDKLSLIYQIYLTDQKNFDLQKRNIELQKHPLQFDIADIRTIFVTTKDEKVDLVHKLISTEKFSDKKNLLEELIVIGEDGK
ncbi:MAG: abortive infection system antitoxin AbiGi family protein [Treponema sp.]|nr:abortive infection system antitoxin AbiGi family protein [Treponema sp.]